MARDPSRPDTSLRIDGAASTFWEPLWHLRVDLSPLEQDLLASRPLRRLHFVAHNGASAILTAHTHSRLQHTLGVFALVAHFRPHDVRLRAAALLHDVGHFPFSHTLEALPGINHHALTQALLRGAELGAILGRHGLELTDLEPVLDGRCESLLRNQAGVLHLDHLDSWVRGAQTRGQLGISPTAMLSSLREVGGYLETDGATAEALVELIVAEARFHASAANLGSSAVLRDLIATLLGAGELSIAELGEMIDAELTARLLASPLTSEGARRLWFGPGHLQLTRTDCLGALVARQEKLYLSLPKVAGKPVDSSRVRALMVEAQALLGEYRVFWQA